MRISDSPVANSEAAKTTLDNHLRLYDLDIQISASACSHHESNGLTNTVETIRTQYQCGEATYYNCL